jgi:hypothetical protein
MSKNTVTTDLVLDGQSNWELWIFVVKRIAEAGDVWKYINPDQIYRPCKGLRKGCRCLVNKIVFDKEATLCSR